MAGVPQPRHEVEQPLDQTTRSIALTKGLSTLIDAENYGYFSQFSWQAAYSKGSDSYYAVRTVIISSVPLVDRQSGMSRLVLGLDPRNPAYADHINGDTLDNRRCNLRIVTERQNSLNRRKERDTKSKRNGVSQSKNGWVARITIDGVRTVLGYRKNLEDAIVLREEAEKKYYGEYARK